MSFSIKFIGETWAASWSNRMRWLQTACATGYDRIDDTSRTFNVNMQLIMVNQNHETSRSTRPWHVVKFKISFCSLELLTPGADEASRPCLYNLGLFCQKISWIESVLNFDSWKTPGAVWPEHDVLNCQATLAWSDWHAAKSDWGIAKSHKYTPPGVDFGMCSCPEVQNLTNSCLARLSVKALEGRGRHIFTRQAVCQGAPRTGDY